MATGYNVRVGDTDREAVAAQLREHFADGRLTLEDKRVTKQNRPGHYFRRNGG